MRFKYTFIAIADTHLSWKLYNNASLEHDNTLLFKRAVDEAINREVSHFIVAGDLYDTHNPSEEYVKFVSEQVARLKHRNITPIGISGDHDKRPGVDTTWIVDVNGFVLHDEDYHIQGINYRNFLNVPEATAALMHKEHTEWLVLHGQEETIFPYVDEKKRLNLKLIDYTQFPNLKGIILGDIHKPMEGFVELPELKRRIPVHYCGSLGVVRSDDIGHNKGVLYYDGTQLSRIPIEQPRTYAKFNLPEDAHTLPQFLKDISNEVSKPLMVVAYTEELSKEHTDSLKAFENITFLKLSRIRKGNVEEVVNIRSEMRTDNKIEGVANKLIEDEELRQLFVNLLQATDYKSLLDQYKEETLNK